MPDQPEPEDKSPTIAEDQDTPESVLVAGSENVSATSIYKGDRVLPERLLTVLELCLVLLIAFGGSVLSSVWTLFTDAGERMSFGNAYYRAYGILEIVIPLSFLAYVLFIAPRARSDLRLGGEESGMSGNRVLSAFHVLRQRRVLLGLCLVSLVAFAGPLMRLAYALIPPDYWGTLGGNFRHLWTCVHDVISLCVLVYVLRRSGRSFSHLGLVWTPAAVGLTLPVFLLQFWVTRIQWPVIPWAARSMVGPGWVVPDIAKLLFGSQVRFASVPAGLLNGFFEELIVRGYLMTEVMRLFGKTWLAILLSVSFQVTYHFYQGLPLGLSHILTFTLFSIIYAKTRSLLPIALAHSAWDLRVLWEYGLDIMNH